MVYADCPSPSGGYQSHIGTPNKDPQGHLYQSLQESFQQAGNRSAKKKQQIDIEVKMASVCYVHSAAFLEEINSCAEDFKQYIANLANSIRLAATEIALGIVSRRTEALSHQAAMEENFGATPPTATPPSGFKRASFRSQTPYSYSQHVLSGEKGSGLVSAPAPTPVKPTVSSSAGGGGPGTGSGKMGVEVNLNLDVVMETPILVVPRYERSFEVLVAHLGRITVRNEVIDEPGQLQFELGPGSATAKRLDRVAVTVSEMNLHSLDLTEKYASFAGDSLNLLAKFRHLLAQELYSCDR